MFGSSNLQDEILKNYIQSIFNKYDYDKSGTLQQNQLMAFFNDLFKTLNINTVVNKQQTLQAIRSIDQNYDGKIDKKQLFDAFKVIMAKPSNQPSITQGPQSYPNAPNYNQPYQPYQQNYPNYPSYGYPPNQYGSWQQPYNNYPSQPCYVGPYSYGSQYPPQSYNQYYGSQTVPEQYNPYTQGPLRNTGNTGMKNSNPYGPQ